MTGDKTNNKHKKTEGFTIVEVLVASSVFIVAITGIVTLFVVTLDAQRSAMAHKEIAENLDFSVEYLTRQMRVAVRTEPEGPYRDYEGDCSGQDDIFRIIPTATGEAMYFLTTAQDDDDLAPVQCKRIDVEGASGNFGGAIRVTSDAGGTNEQENYLTDRTVVDIEEIRFHAEGQARGPEGPGEDSRQPRITFSIKGGHLGTSREEQAAEFETQTTVTIRALDVE